MECGCARNKKNLLLFELENRQSFSAGIPDATINYSRKIPLYLFISLCFTFQGGNRIKEFLKNNFSSSWWLIEHIVVSAINAEARAIEIIVIWRCAKVIDETLIRVHGCWLQTIAVDCLHRDVLEADRKLRLNHFCLRLEVYGEATDGLEYTYRFQMGRTHDAPEVIAFPARSAVSIKTV